MFHQFRKTSFISHKMFHFFPVFGFVLWFFSGFLGYFLLVFCLGFLVHLCRIFFYICFLGFFFESCCQLPRLEGEGYENSQATMNPDYFGTVCTEFWQSTVFLFAEKMIIKHRWNIYNILSKPSRQTSCNHFSFYKTCFLVSPSSRNTWQRK